MKEDADQYESTDKQETVYTRMSISKRGHFSNLFTFSPIREISITKHGFTIKKNRRDCSFNWSDVDQAYTLRKEAYKGYGAGSYGKYLQTVLVIDTNAQKIKLDISTNFPDFNNSQSLVKDLNKYLDIKKGEITKKNDLIWWAVFILLLVGAVFYNHMK